MPTVTASLPKKSAPTADHGYRNSRGWVWSAVFIGSRLPEIICRQFGFTTGMWLPLSQTGVLICLAVLAARLNRNRNVAGFISAVAALNFSWLVVVPLVEQSSAVHSAMQYLGWAGGFFLSRAIRIIGALAMVLTLIGSGIGRGELYLRVGDWRAQVNSRLLSHVRSSISWARFAWIVLGVFGVVLPVFLYSTLHPQIARLHGILPLFAWALATATLNAANEEFQFRSVLLARLQSVVGKGEACLISAALFGINHYFGQPSGWAGVLMAGIAGGIWAKSMVETRGIGCAFVTHFVQDVVIFVFLALSVRP